MDGIGVVQFAVVEGDGLEALESGTAEYDCHKKNDYNHRSSGSLLVSLRLCSCAGSAPVLDGEEYKSTNRYRARRDG